MKKMLTSLLLVAALLFTSVPVAPVANAASPALVTRSEALQWARNHADNRTAFDVDGIYGVQCSDFGTAYINWLISGSTALNKPYTTYNGYQYFDINYPDGWVKIKNTPDFVPQPGDILVWGTSWGGGAGHVAVADEGCTTSIIKCIEQSGTAKAPTRYNTYNSYNGFVGAVRPLFKSEIVFDKNAAPTISINQTYFRYGENTIVSWKPFTGAEKYEYWVSEFPEGYAYEQNARHGSTTNTSITFNDLPNGRYVVFVHAFASDGTQSAQSNCIEFYVYRTNYFPDKSVSKNGHIYAAYSNNPVSWDFAKRICEDMGGHLVTITSAEEQATVAALIKEGSGDGYWIGATNTNAIYAGLNGQPYFWITGEPFEYSSWNPGEPNADGSKATSEHFAEIRKSYNYNWNDLPNQYKNGFILEIETDKIAPVATSIVGKSKFMLFDKSMTWTEAETYCESIGGHLATLSTKEEDDAVSALLKKGIKKWCYIGASGETGTWKWVDGSAVKLSGDYHNWGQDDKADKEDGPIGWGKFLMKYKASGRWIGIDNLYFPASDVWNIGFVCEIDLASYNVTYNANGGTGAPAAQTKTQSVALTLSNTNPTRTGYTFQGWATSASATTAAYAAGASYTNDANVTLYAVWKPNTYTVTYNANGGAGAPAAQTKTHDVEMTLSSTVPTKAGYIFKGWATSEDSTTVAYAADASYTGNADITLYALWKEDFQRTIVMKKELTRAYVDGGVYLTTDYGNGIRAKAMSKTGGYVLPLRYIAEKFHMTVDYLGGGQTKITDVDGNYLIVNRDSTVISKYYPNGTLKRNIENTIATFTEDGVTYVPLRAVSEALGLGVRYQSTSHGSYVVISTNKNIDSEIATVNTKIENAYALGI